MRDITNESDNIRELQRYLREIHYAEGSIPLVNPDGIYGAETRVAVEEFQRKNELPVTGRVDHTTWRRIYAANLDAVGRNAPPHQISPFPRERGYVITEGEYSDIVAVVQFILRLLANAYDDIDGDEPDGVYNESTINDIKNFQRAHGLPITGEVDKATWNALADAYNRLAEIID